MSDQNLLTADLTGHLEYDWDQQDLSPAGHARTPRDAAVEDITERLNSLSPTGHEAHCTNTIFLLHLHRASQVSLLFFRFQPQYPTGLLLAPSPLLVRDTDATQS